MSPPDASAAVSSEPALSGRRALVTGGGSGIGPACARVLAGLGARVTVADLDGALVSAAAAEINGRDSSMVTGAASPTDGGWMAG